MPKLSVAPRSGPPRYMAVPLYSNCALSPVTGRNDGCSLYRSRTRFRSNSSWFVFWITSLYRCRV